MQRKMIGMVADTEADILERVLEPDQTGALPPEVSRYLLTLAFRPADHQRIEELAEKSNEGKLTPAERAELERYNRVRLWLVRMKSKARHALSADDTSGRQP
jgi:hypothetical protein